MNNDICASMAQTHIENTGAQFLYCSSCSFLCISCQCCTHSWQWYNNWLDLGGGLRAALMEERLIELEVLSMSGECMLTLNVSDSMLGRELWKRMLDKVPCKPGLQLVVSHTSRLALSESLQQQGLGGQRAQVSATYIPVNLCAALRFAHGCNVEDEEFTLNGITEMTMTGASHETTALLQNLPESLRKLTFAHRFDPGLHGVTWPAGLRSLTFGLYFDQSLDNVIWPAGLQSVTFGDRFDRSLDNVTWPAGLQSLTFGARFNQNLDNVAWPAGLQSLTFGSFTSNFNQSLDNVTWPAGLQSLIFGRDFNQSLDNVRWPAGLQRLTFGWFFDQSLDNVTWPAGLQSLTFAGEFNQSLDSVTWPEGLQSLTFGLYFDQSLDNVTWPAGLQSLTFGLYFDQSLDNVTWPAGLQSLTFGQRFNQNLDNVTWPAGLQSLTFGWFFDQSLDNVTWPAGLQSLTFPGIRGRRLAESGVVLPRTLRTVVTREVLLSCWAKERPGHSVVMWGWAVWHW